MGLRLKVVGRKPADATQGLTPLQITDTTLCSKASLQELEIQFSDDTTIFMKKFQVSVKETAALIIIKSTVTTSIIIIC